MIKISNLSKSFTKTIVLNQLELTIPTGDTVVILGASGAGKTTLLRLIAGLDFPDQGEIILDEEVVSTNNQLIPSHQRDVGFLFQTTALWPHLNVYQNVAFGLKGRSKQEIAEKTDQILRYLDISSLRSRFPSQLSGGQLRRTALARTLVTEPKFLLLDEPLIHLDPDLQDSLLDYLMDIMKDTQITSILVTHRKLPDELFPTKSYILKDGFLHAV